MKQGTVTVTEAEYTALVRASALVDAEAESDDYSSEIWNEDIELLNQLRSKIAKAIYRA